MQDCPALDSKAASAVIYSRSNFPQEVKDLLDVADAFLPAADDLLPPHLGSNRGLLRRPQQHSVPRLSLELPALVERRWGSGHEAGGKGPRLKTAGLVI